MVERPRVAMFTDDGGRYPHIAPFDPSESFPELNALQGGHPPLAGEPNAVYRLVRKTLAAAGLDEQRFGRPDWNPLAGLVPRSGLVVLKPNLVLEATKTGDHEAVLTTHGAVVRVLIDYVRLAGGRDVEIIIGDVPLQGADFERIVSQNGLRQTIEALRRRGDDHIALYDLRRERAVVDANGFISRLDSLPGDPRGYCEVNIGHLSRLEGLEPDNFENFAVTDYGQAKTRVAHAAGKHSYLIPRSVLAADLLINIPKLKTHQKAGLTVAMKNLVGINGDKSRIPHFRRGRHGDEYPTDQAWLRAFVSGTQRLLQGRSQLLYRATRGIWRATRGALINPSTEEIAAGATTLVGGGAWSGNDTLWRAIHDLNHIVMFAAREGALSETVQRRYLCVVDGIIAGEGDGPLHPMPRREGLVIVGDDALAVDLAAANYMHFDWRRIPLLADAVARAPAWTRLARLAGLDGIGFVSNRGAVPLEAKRPFLAAPGWRAELERAA